MKEPVHIFLGANSAEGFCSLYEQLLGTRFDDLLIIKGGPGCGKSSFMRAVARELAAAGVEQIHVNCSGDPDSLDGALFPALRAGIVDGTAPHVLEPRYTAAAERYLDLTRFYDLDAAKAAREEIVVHSGACRAAYDDAYRSLRAANAVASVSRAAVKAASDTARLEKRFDGIVRRELRGKNGARRGRVDRAFLGGTTHQGELCRFDTVDALCPRVYELADSFGMAERQLRRAAEAAAEAGLDVLACPDPDRPTELRHVLVPARGVAFVTSTTRLPYPGRAYRRLRVDAAALERMTRAERARLRFIARVEQALRDEAVLALRRAKTAHDALEAAYNPCVDFDGVYTLAAAEAKRLLAMC